MNKKDRPMTVHELAQLLASVPNQNLPVYADVFVWDKFGNELLKVGWADLSYGESFDEGLFLTFGRVLEMDGRWK